ncbi:MAG TPA: hypothetical protein VH415_09815 [Nitrososphaeraceae archaeon]|jgi:hypothetical protein
MSGCDRENIARIDDSMKVGKLISRRFLVELYKKSDDAEFAGQSTSFTMNQIIHEAFHEEEKQIVYDYFKKHSEFFEGEYLRRESNENIKLTNEGKVWVRILYPEFFR